MNLANQSDLVDFLKRNKLSPKKKFGQNFLVDPEVLAKILTAANLKEKDHVIEIGAGLGILTKELAKQADRVTALEIDSEIFQAAKRNLTDYQNIELKNIDVRRFELPKGSYKLVANIPYYLTSPILRKFLVETKNQPDLIVLLIQKEVAERICHPTKKSVLSWQVEIFGTAEIVMEVPRESFLPPPKVKSAVIRIRLRDQPLIPEKDLGKFFGLLHAGFRAPRKKISGSLIAGLPYEKIQSQELIKKSGINTELRPEDLKLADWQKLLVTLPKTS